MRLICPNCDAHYEVDAALIPPAGRDVQCSDCGHVWFEDGVQGLVMPEPETAAPTQVVAPPDGRSDAGPVESAAAASAGPEPLPPTETLPDDGTDEVGLRPLAQRSLDETLLSVLREEAEREVQARARESGGLVETQPDLGLDTAPSAPRRRIVVRANAASDAEPSEDGEAAASAQSMDQEDAPESSPARPSRRELLPDIDQINSTLRASGEKRRAGAAGEDELQLPQPRQSRRRGFRIGFLTVLGIAILGAGIYAYASQIAAAVPAMGQFLDSYVTQIDALRHALDKLLLSTLERLKEASGP